MSGYFYIVIGLILVVIGARKIAPTRVEIWYPSVTQLRTDNSDGGKTELQLFYTDHNGEKREEEFVVRDGKIVQVKP